MLAAVCRPCGALLFEDAVVQGLAPLASDRGPLGTGVWHPKKCGLGLEASVGVSADRRPTGAGWPRLLQPAGRESANRIDPVYRAELQVARKGVFASEEFVSPTFKQRGPPCLELKSHDRQDFFNGPTVLILSNR